ncbi:hypothetical protein ACUXJP_001186 [Staphylococcus cohnii]|jgi:hypothetical protein
MVVSKDWFEIYQAVFLTRQFMTLSWINPIKIIVIDYDSVHRMIIQLGGSRVYI